MAAHIFAFLLAALAASIYVIIRARVFSAEPLQQAPKRNNILSFLAVVLVFLIYFFIGNLAAIATAHVSMSQKSTVVEILAGLSAIAATCIFSRTWFENGLSGLGIIARNIPRGVGLGVLSFAVIAPILYVSILVTDVASRLITHKLPPVHPALKAMATDHSPISLAFLVLMVVIVAPISEELFFRGLIQSWLSQKFMLIGSKTATTPANSAAAHNTPWGQPDIASTASEERPSSDSTAGVPAPPSPPPPPQWPQSPWLPRRRWIAILLTAAVFAGVHYVVTPGYDEYFPVLFLLAVALGYMYERTGNIWTDITMHACFNLIPTILILCGIKPK